jgi:ribosome-binding protein aMBF1 (putative translation factor)
MDCETCGRHRPSHLIAPVRSSTGTVVMVCSACRKHTARVTQPRAATPGEVSRAESLLIHSSD